MGPETAAESALAAKAAAGLRAESLAEELDTLDAVKVAIAAPCSNNIATNPEWDGNRSPMAQFEAGPAPGRVATPSCETVPAEGQWGAQAVVAYICQGGHPQGTASNTASCNNHD